MYLMCPSLLGDELSGFVGGKRGGKGLAHPDLFAPLHSKAY